MSRRYQGGVAGIAIVICLVLITSAAKAGKASSSSGETLTIRASSSGLHSLGGFRPERNPKLKAAIRAFGHPTALQKRYRGTACRVMWKRLGLRMIFVYYGGGGGRLACDPRRGIAETAAIQGRAARSWQTDRGLHVGDSRAQLLKLYPAAGLIQGRYWLATGHSHIGTGGYYPVLSASVRSGHVVSFGAEISAGFD